MKSEVAISLTSSLLLLLFLSSPSPALSIFPPHKWVYDIHGHHILTGTKYFLDFGRGAASGGVTIRNGTCPLDVVRDRPLFDGLPVTLTLADGSAQQGIRVQNFASVKIKFSEPEANSVNTCQSSMEWNVGSNDDETGLRTITTGTSERFTIMDSGLPNINKLVYCGPSMCNGDLCTRDNACRFVGQTEGRLFAGGSALFIGFRKA